MNSHSPIVRSRWLTWNRCAFLVWLIVAAIIAARVAHAPHRNTSFTPYLEGGEHWRAGEMIYSTWKGFVYSPLTAAFFSLFTWIPVGVGNLLWRYLNGGVFVWGLWRMLATGPFSSIDPRRRGIVLLLVLPLALGNIDTAQANSLVIGLMMLSVSAAAVGAWTLAALGIAVATHFKIYPIALGMVLCVVRPREMTLRLVLSLVALTALSFVLQSPSYVAGQYQAWIDTRLGDNRLNWSLGDATLDITYLIARVGHIPVTRTVYRGMEMAGGGVIAFLCLFAVVRQWPWRRLLGQTFLLVSVWMVLLGPATEGFTYIMLAPCACLCAVRAFAPKTPAWARAFGAGGYLFLLAAAARASLAPGLRGVYAKALQPVGGLLILVFIVAWMWPMLARTLGRRSPACDEAGSRRSVPVRFPSTRGKT